MKNVLILAILSVVFLSCSKSGDSDSEQDCAGSNGFISGTIDGESLSNGCNVGSLATMQDSGFDFFVSGSSQGFLTLDQNEFNGFILSITSVTGIKNECINLSGGEFISDVSGSETNFGLTFYNNLNLVNSNSAEEEAKIFSTVEDTDFQLCVDEYSAANGIVKGTFSGIVRNGLGETKTIANGIFDFDVE